MHPLTSALLQRQAPPSTGVQANAEEEAAPEVVPGHEDHQQLRGQGVELPSTLQSDDDDF